MVRDLKVTKKMASEEILHEAAYRPRNWTTPDKKSDQHTVPAGDPSRHNRKPSSRGRWRVGGALEADGRREWATAPASAN